MRLEDLTRNQKVKAIARKTTVGIIAPAKKEGIALTDAELESVSGGWADCTDACGHENIC